MEDQVKEILEGQKKKHSSTLPVPYTRRAKRNLYQQQGNYMQKHGKKITIKALGGLLLETATLPK